MINNKAISGSVTSLTPQAFFSGIIRVGVTALLIIAALYFFFKLVLGGIAWINSSGDKTRLETARGTILNAIIGIIVVIMSYAIVKFMESVFGVTITTFEWSTLVVS